MKTVFTFLLLFLSITCWCQADKKLSPLLIEKTKRVRPTEKMELILSVTNVEEFSRMNPGINILHVYEPAGVVIIRIIGMELDSLLKQGRVLFADELRIPVEELLVGNYDLGTNRVNVVHHLYPLYNGNGLVLSVKEQRPDTTDLDLRGRYLATNLSAATQSAHATIMSTIAAGGGNTFYQGKGAAWSSTISSSNFATLLPDADAAYQQYNISVQNHSYGTGIENFYGADARAYDQSSINNPALLHVFSAGNSGTQTSNSGPYANVNSYANITGSFKMAKNIITIGHTDSAGNVLAPSSRGPAYDGRVKPELVAFGEDGSSGAAALVSGISLMLQQAYKDVHGSLPNSTLIKALLLNSADDVGSPGIDFKSGYGSVNAYRSMKTLLQQRYFTGSVTNGNSQDFGLTVPAGIRKIRVTLVWKDPAAAANASKALVNDLDMELQLPSSSLNWQPWVLSSFPHVDSLIKLPVRKRDSLNNVEQITVDAPPAGNYNIHVNGFSVTGAQQFFIAWQFDSTDVFTWYYPTGSDPVISSDTNFIRWSSGFAAATGQLEYTTDGINWSLIGNNIDLASGYQPWQAPAGFTTARLRMTVGSNVFLSDSFVVSRPLTTRVGFNCADSFYFSWEKITGINSYQVYRLGTKFLEPLQMVTDTFIVLAKNANPSFHYTVAPIVGTKTGVKSFTFDYRNQGVGCYVKSFLANLVGTTGVLELELGTTYRIQRITWEKLTTNGFISLQSITPVNSLFHSFTDVNLNNGFNTYRVKIELVNGQVIYSQPETIQYFRNTNYIVIPNPVAQNQQVTIISKDANNETLQIFNSSGMKVLEVILDDARKVIPSDRLSKGVYIGRIEGKPDIIKFVVY